ncbi:MAG TPA: DNA repair protein RecO, partial [Flavobacteriaceae bacterium]|nr:DNA repair protein RecO [Flavobacteriaceae bacterium]
TQLYNYIEQSLIWYDTNKFNPYFHMIFLLELTRYLGFYPDTLNNNFKYFNLEEGAYEKLKTSKYSITGDSLNLLKQILGIKFDNNPLPTLNSDDKMEILNIILVYYKLHNNNFKPIKSLEIVKNIFS